MSYVLSLTRPGLTGCGISDLQGPVLVVREMADIFDSAKLFLQTRKSETSDGMCPFRLPPGRGASEQDIRRARAEWAARNS